MMDAVKKLEVEFKKLNKDGISKRKNTMKNVINKLILRFENLFLPKKLLNA